MNKKGAMIPGLTAAERLESANAAVISTNDLFPTGTITMKDLKVLANNHFDATIMRAASLTAAVNSPLYPIFQRIAGTNSSYTMPDSDTVKYEEHLGLSGWVDNELLFIGNRTLMEAHGITVPSFDFDKRILKEGYFPVYLASGNEAYAVIIIEYNVNAYVAKQVQRLTNSGVTLLISNNDPNVTEQMLRDHFGLYEDSVKIMSNAGNRIYKTSTQPALNVSAAGAFRGRPLTLITMLNCAARIKKSNLILMLSYIALAIIGLTVFVYSSFAGGSEPIITLPLIYSVSATALSILAFTVRKP
ncbi:MAG: hypothetical protein MJ091_06580 [Clostridia bacterium]|nr:hypothetical protein [Clostridia bacterium]